MNEINDDADAEESDEESDSDEEESTEDHVMRDEERNEMKAFRERHGIPNGVFLSPLCLLACHQIYESY